MIDSTPLSETVPRLLDLPNDRPKNHTVLCGAKVAKVCEKGEYLNCSGQISSARVICDISDTSAKYYVEYGVKYNDGSSDRLTPLQVLRKLANYHGVLLSLRPTTCCRMSQFDCLLHV